LSLFVCLFGFFDDTAVRTCRPGSGPFGPRDGPSSYIKGHRLKYQNILFPNGMAAGVFGISMSHNDVGVLNMSNLTCHIMAGGLLPAVYGDSIFLIINHSTIICWYDLVGTPEENKLIRR
jgi:hypothetical protein